MPNKDVIHWGWREFEDIIQCHICIDIVQSSPGSTVEQCIYGHHICAKCRARVDSCPTCKSDYIGTRNFVVEELLRHYEILKNIMNMYASAVESSEESKVELNASAPVFKPREPERCNNVSEPSKGIYPCRFGNCDVRLPAGRLLNHVRSFHASKLVEASLDRTGSYTHHWELTFKNTKPITNTSFVLFVSKIGLVFFNIEILKTGQLIATLRANMKYAQAQTYVGCIEFYSEIESYSHSVRLVSVKDNIENMMIKKNCFVLTRNQLRKICYQSKYHCKLKLSQFNPIAVLPTQNVEEISAIAHMRKTIIAEEENKKRLKKSEQSKGKGKKNNAPNHVNHSQPQSSSILPELLDKGKLLKELLDSIGNNGLLTELLQNNSNLGHTNSVPVSAVAAPSTPANNSSKRKKNRRSRK